MITAREYLLSLAQKPDECFSLSVRDLLPLQIEAAQALFKIHRERIYLLQRLAKNASIDKIRELKHIVTLLFPHRIYKSYPSTALKNSEWERLTRWFGLLSAIPLDNVELEGIANIDNWVERMWGEGHCIQTTSGTTGKISFLDRTPSDIDFVRTGIKNLCGWPKPLKPERTRHFFFFAPRPSLSRTITNDITIDLFIRPDSIHYLNNEISRLAELFEARKEEGKNIQPLVEQMDILAEKLFKARHEPCFVKGTWAQLWPLIEKAKIAGVPNGDFHPETMLIATGGLKGSDLPSDYRKQVMDLFGNVRVTHIYGMSEMSWMYPSCEAGNFHPPPWNIPFVLDANGNTQVGDRTGVSRGRFAYLDLATVGRWNGLITSDEVTVDFRGKCLCGRQGTVLQPKKIVRYCDINKEDSIYHEAEIIDYLIRKTG